MQNCQSPSLLAVIFNHFSLIYILMSKSTTCYSFPRLFCADKKLVAVKIAIFLYDSLM